MAKMLGKSRAMGKSMSIFGQPKKRLMVKDPTKGAVLKEVETEKDDVQMKVEKSKQVSMEIRSSAELIHSQLMAAKEALISSDESMEPKKKEPETEEKSVRKTRKTTRK